MNIKINDAQKEIKHAIINALKEDVGSGDITAQLIPADKNASAYIITRDDCVLCGQKWLNETFAQIDPNVNIEWHAQDGDYLNADTKLVSLQGNARALLTGERTALNFLQFLSATATLAHSYAQLVKGTDIKILDTRKTIPGYRVAQKYAVAVGGCHNHRIGLYDAYLIKENHISACGGIERAIEQARKNSPGKPVEIEVETLEQLDQALATKVDIIMLDNFTDEMLDELSNKNLGQTKLELSGNMDAEKIKRAAQYNIDYISVGGLTKNIQAIDLSMRIIDL